MTMTPAAEFDFEQLKAAATQASSLLKSLSHPDRLLLLCQLVQGEACVQELETLTGIKQPSLSQQLGILRESKLVATRREGRQIYYRIDSKDAMAVLEVLYQRFCDPVTGTNYPKSVTGMSPTT